MDEVEQCVRGVFGYYDCIMIHTIGYGNNIIITIGIEFIVKHLSIVSNEYKTDGRTGASGIFCHTRMALLSDCGFNWKP